MKEKLKPCPFCGSDDLEIYIKGTGRRKYAVCCNTCDARGERTKIKEEAATAWNRRVE